MCLWKEEEDLKRDKIEPVAASLTQQCRSATNENSEGKQDEP